MDCKICLLEYSEESADQTPVILTNCGHTVCKKCASEIRTKSNSNQVLCPFCRAVTSVTDINNLPKNYALLEVPTANDDLSKIIAPLSIKEPKSILTEIVGTWRKVKPDGDWDILSYKIGNGHFMWRGISCSYFRWKLGVEKEEPNCKIKSWVENNMIFTTYRNKTTVDLKFRYIEDGQLTSIHSTGDRVQRHRYVKIGSPLP